MSLEESWSCSVPRKMVPARVASEVGILVGLRALTSECCRDHPRGDFSREKICGVLGRDVMRRAGDAQSPLARPLPVPGVLGGPRPRVPGPVPPRTSVSPRRRRNNLRAAGRARKAWLSPTLLHPSQGEGRLERGHSWAEEWRHTRGAGGGLGWRFGAEGREEGLGLGLECQQRRGWVRSGRGGPRLRWKISGLFSPRPAPGSSLRCPLSKARISQKHRCLSRELRWGHQPRCQRWERALGLRNYPSLERSPSLPWDSTPHA